MSENVADSMGVINGPQWYNGGVYFDGPMRRINHTPASGSASDASSDVSDQSRGSDEEAFTAKNSNSKRTPRTKLVLFVVLFLILGVAASVGLMWKFGVLGGRAAPAKQEATAEIQATSADASQVEQASTIESANLDAVLKPEEEIERLESLSEAPSASADAGVGIPDIEQSQELVENEKGTEATRGTRGKVMRGVAIGGVAAASVAAAAFLNKVSNGNAAVQAAQQAHEDWVLQQPLSALEHVSGCANEDFVEHVRVEIAKEGSDWWNMPSLFGAKKNRWADDTAASLLGPKVEQCNGLVAAKAEEMGVNYESAAGNTDASRYGRAVTNVLAGVAGLGALTYLADARRGMKMKSQAQEQVATPSKSGTEQKRVYKQGLASDNQKENLAQLGEWEEGPEWEEAPESVKLLAKFDLLHLVDLWHNGSIVGRRVPKIVADIQQELGPGSATGDVFKKTAEIFPSALVQQLEDQLNGEGEVFPSREKLVMLWLNLTHFVHSTERRYVKEDQREKRYEFVAWLLEQVISKESSPDSNIWDHLGDDFVDFVHLFKLYEKHSPEDVNALLRIGLEVATNPDFVEAPES